MNLESSQSILVDLTNESDDKLTKTKYHDWALLHSPCSLALVMFVSRIRDWIVSFCFLPYYFKNVFDDDYYYYWNFKFELIGLFKVF